MRLSGWPLTGWICLAVLALCAGALGVAGAGEEGARLCLRATARSSLVLFLLAFAARPLAQLWRSGASRWLLRNRRYLGVGFAASHSAHGVAILWLSFGFGASTDAATLVLGGFGYALLAAMTLTSTDTTARWLGAHRWKQLHSTGMWVLWVIFAATFAGTAAERGSLASLVPVAVLLAAVALRGVAWLRRRSRREARAAA